MLLDWASKCTAGPTVLRQAMELVGRLIVAVARRRGLPLMTYNEPRPHTADAWVTRRSRLLRLRRRLMAAT